MKLNRKKTLITSLIAMILCMVMLAGATYAAFSDTASASIHIGAQDFNMSLAYKNFDGSEKVDGPSASAEWTTIAETSESSTVELTGLTIDGTWTSRTYWFKISNTGALDFDLNVSIEKTNDYVDATGNIDSDTVLGYKANYTTEAPVDDTVSSSELSFTTNVATVNSTAAIAKTSGVGYLVVTITCADSLESGSYSNIDLVLTFTANQVTA